MDQPADDFIEAEVERALRPYRTVLPAGDLAVLEGMVRDMLRDDLTAMALVRAARPRATPLQSGDSPAPGARLEPEKKRSQQG